MLAEEVMPASARVATTKAFAAATEAFLRMAAAEGMETTLVRRFVGRPGEALTPKSRRGRTLRKIVALKACACRGTIGLLRNAIGPRPAAVEAGAIRRAPVLLRRIDRRLHVVVSLLHRPVVAFGRPAPGISLRGAGKSLAISRAVATILAIATRAVASGHGPALGEVAAPAVLKAPVTHRGAVCKVIRLMEEHRRGQPA